MGGKIVQGITITKTHLLPPIPKLHPSQQRPNGRILRIQKIMEKIRFAKFIL